MYKTIFVVALCIAATACGGAQVVMPQDGGGCCIATPTPTPVPPAPTPTPNPNFVPPQPLTCTGNILVGGGQQCTFSDGVSFYRADQFSEAIGPDGHGTFQIISEEGFNGTALHQVTFTFPVPIRLLEIHGTASIDSWCNNNGVVTTWDSNATDGTIGHIVGAKNFLFNSGDTVSYVIPQTVFPAPIPIASVTHNVFVDLCAGSTIHWVLFGSF